MLLKVNFSRYVHHSTYHGTSGAPSAEPIGFYGIAFILAGLAIVLLIAFFSSRKTKMTNKD